MVECESNMQVYSTKYQYFQFFSLKALNIALKKMPVQLEMVLAKKVMLINSVIMMEEIAAQKA